MKSTTICLLSILLAAQIRDAFAEIVAPNQFATTGGDSSNFAPFGIAANPPTSFRYQQVYAASQFSAINPGGGMITAFALRFEIPATGLGTTLPDIQINFSTTSKGPDALSTTFADNVGANDSVVAARGPLGLGGTIPGDPTFTALMNLSTPFFYDPSAGNLLMDVRYYETASPAFSPGPFDASKIAGDSISRVYAFGVGSTTGTADTTGLVTAFIVTPIPEPSTTWLLLLGFPAILFAIHRQNHKTPKTKENYGTDS